MIATTQIGLGKMATDEGDKKKLPHAASDILEMEDTIEQIARKLKDLRNLLQTGPMPTVELMSGTFKFRANQCLRMAKKFLSEYDTQATDYKAERTRDIVRNEKDNRSQKRSR